VIADYMVLAARIEQELMALEQLVTRTERAMVAMHRYPDEADLLVDSAALNLHDFYVGLERVFEQIAKVVDNSVPSGREWHRDLLWQMGVELPQLRPAVLREATVESLDEFLRFRHVVRHIYAFLLNRERLEPLATEARPTWVQVKQDLSHFIAFLRQIGADGGI
jgi:hypothetical protein